MAELSNDGIEAVIAAATGEAFVVLLTIDHAEFETPVRVTSDAVATTSQTRTFNPYPFEYREPVRSPTEIGRGRLRINNVDPEILGKVREVPRGDLIITAEVVRASDPDTIEVGPLEFEAEDVPWDGMWIDAALGGDSYLNDRWPATLFAPSTTPGLF